MDEKYNEYGDYSRLEMSSHGGAREGAGRRSKFTDDEGNPIKSKARLVPDILTDKDLQDLARKKIKEINTKRKEKQ